MLSKRKLNWGVDSFLFGIILVLIFLGILILASVSASFSLQTFGSTYYFLRHQLLFGLLRGVLGGCILFFVPLKILKKWSLPALLFSILLLLLAWAPSSSGSALSCHVPIGES